MYDLENVLGAGFIRSMMYVDERPTKFFACDSQPSFLVVNILCDWVDAEEGLDFAPIEEPFSTGNPAQDLYCILAFSGR